MAEIEKVIALISDDPEVKMAAKSLALQALAHASDLLENGNDTIRMRIIGSMLPAFTKSLNESKKGTTEDEIKKDFAELRAEIMGDDEVEDSEVEGHSETVADHP